MQLRPAVDFPKDKHFSHIHERIYTSTNANIKLKCANANGKNESTNSMLCNKVKVRIYLSDMLNLLITAFSLPNLSSSVMNCFNVSRESCFHSMSWELLYLDPLGSTNKR